MLLIRVFSIVFLFVTSTSCASRRHLTRADLPVYHTPDGIIKTEAWSKNKETARRKALKTANQYCDFTNEIAVIINEEILSDGVFDEDMQQAAQTVGSISKIFGKNEITNIVNNDLFDINYHVTIKFNCKCKEY